MAVDCTGRSFYKVQEITEGEIEREVEGRAGYAPATLATIIPSESITQSQKDALPYSQCRQSLKLEGTIENSLARVGYL